MVNNVSNNSTTAAATMKQSTGVNKDDFLKLFVTQLQNQDPLNPQDSSQFIAQLAQLTQVEQAYNTTQGISQLQKAMENSTNLTAASFIGREILAEGDRIALTAGKSAQLQFRLDHAAESLALEIKDPSGQPVRMIKTGNWLSGDTSIEWDGKDNNGRQLPAGTYTYSITAANTDGSTFAGTPLVKGKVDGVKLEGSKPYLVSGGNEIALEDLMAVKGVM